MEARVQFLMAQADPEIAAEQQGVSLESIMAENPLGPAPAEQPLEELPPEVQEAG